MFIKSLRNKFFVGGEDDLGLLYSPPQFRRILDRERALADRNQTGFSVLAFSVEFRGREPKAARRLAATLSRQIRLSDETGWFSEEEIGVLLPQTPAEGAARLAERVKLRMSEQGFERDFSYSVYVYPSPGPGSGGNGGPGGRASKDSPATGGDGARGGPQAVSRRSLQPRLIPAIPRWKRILDLAGASLGLLAASPLFLALAVLIKASSPGPVFFRQERVGYRGRTFTLWKFRTMHVDSESGLHRRHFRKLMEEDGRPMTKLDSGRDPRVIRGGRLLRAAGLDELPQLFNVLRGEMSLVGPRPCIPYEADGYEQWQSRRFDTLPGLTGLWQVEGKNRTTFKQMMRLDISYLRGRSLCSDLWIAAKTIPAIVEQQRLAGKQDDAPRRDPGGEGKCPERVNTVPARSARAAGSGNF